MNVKQKTLLNSNSPEDFVSVFYSQEDRPLRAWKKSVLNGKIARLRDLEMQCNVLEVSGSNTAKCYITTPIELGKSLGIKLPIMVLLVKSLGTSPFQFEVQVIDNRKIRRRFRISSNQTLSSVMPFLTIVPLRMAPGWNKIEIDLKHFTKEAYGTDYKETVRLQIHPNVRIRRIYFTDRPDPMDVLALRSCTLLTK